MPCGKPSKKAIDKKGVGPLEVSGQGKLSKRIFQIDRIEQNEIGFCAKENK